MRDRLPRKLRAVAHSTRRADARRMTVPHELRDRSAHRVPDRNERVDAQHVGQRDDIVGAVRQPEPLRAHAAPVAPVIDREHAVVRPSGPKDHNQFKSAVAARPCSSTTTGAPGGPRDLAHERGASARQLDQPLRRAHRAGAATGQPSRPTTSTFSVPRRRLVVDDVARRLARAAPRRAASRAR